MERHCFIDNFLKYTQSESVREIRTTIGMPELKAGGASRRSRKLLGFYFNAVNRSTNAFLLSIFFMEVEKGTVLFLGMS